MNTAMFSKVIEESFRAAHEPYAIKVEKVIEPMLQNPDLSAKDISKLITAVHFDSVELAITSTLFILQKFHCLPDVSEDVLRACLIHSMQDQTGR